MHCRLAFFMASKTGRHGFAHPFIVVGRLTEISSLDRTWKGKAPPSGALFISIAANAPFFTVEPCQGEGEIGNKLSNIWVAIYLKMVKKYPDMPIPHYDVH